MFLEIKKYYKKELKKLLLEHEVTREWAKEVVKDVLDHETFTDDRGRIDMKWSSNTLNWSERENDYLNIISILEKSLCEHTGVYFFSKSPWRIKNISRFNHLFKKVISSKISFGKEILKLTFCFVLG